MKLLFLISGIRSQVNRPATQEYDMGRARHPSTKVSCSITCLAFVMCLPTQFTKGCKSIQQIHAIFILDDLHFAPEHRILCVFRFCLSWFFNSCIICLSEQHFMVTHSDVLNSFTGLESVFQRHCECLSSLHLQT